MNSITTKHLLQVLVLIGAMSSMPAPAAVASKPAFVPVIRVQPVTSRLIVKMRVNKPEQVMSVQQRYAELSRPFAAAELQQLQFVAGGQLSDLRVTGTGSHVMSLTGIRGTQTVALAVVAIRKLPNVEYAEEDRIETIQANPNPYYTTGPGGYPGQWAMQPVTAVTGISSGYTGSYGADFQTAWATSTGVGVVVAVIDTGITPHPDIVGPAGVIDAGAGSNLVSPGYTFISDCRIRGATAVGGCAASWPPTGLPGDPTSVNPPTPGALDTGDYISAQDKLDNPDWSTLTAADSTWHGTHVVGIIAAIGNNGIGVIGGAYNAKILPVRAMGKGGGWGGDISDAIMWAANAHPTIPNPNPARVINLSLGSINPCGQQRQDAINAAVNKGVVVVVAAGNENRDVADASAANCSNVISVAAVSRDGSRARYSNFSSPSSNTINPTSVTLAAQGSDVSPSYLSFDHGILSTLNASSQVVDTTPAGGIYDYYQGTSMATPHVSAAVALMLSYNPALTPARVKQILSTPAALTPFPSFWSGWASRDCVLNKNCGAGILNAHLALQNSTTVAPSGGGGGGGCAIMPPGARPDVSLLLAVLAVAAYWLRRRVVRGRSAD